MFCSHIQGLILRWKFDIDQAVSAFVLSLFCFCSNAQVARSVADYKEPAWNFKLHLKAGAVMMPWQSSSSIVYLDFFKCIKLPSLTIHQSALKEETRRQILRV